MLMSWMFGSNIRNVLQWLTATHKYYLEREAVVITVDDSSAYVTMQLGWYGMDNYTPTVFALRWFHKKVLAVPMDGPDLVLPFNGLALVYNRKADFRDAVEFAKST